MEKWKLFTLPGLELPLPLVVQPVASRYTDWAIPAPTIILKVYKIFPVLLKLYAMKTYGGVEILDRRQGGPQNRSGRRGKKILLSLSEIEPKPSSP
jgi:hypothetical protein